MQRIFPLLGFVYLAGCMTPVTSIEGAIPFSQVLAETADRPYECFNYDHNTDSCTGYATHEPQGNGRYIGTTVTLAEEGLPALQATYSVIERGDTVCSESSTTVFSFTQNASLTAELQLAQFESVFRTREDTCFVYSRTETGFRSQVVSGFEDALENPISEYHYFATAKRLRTRR